MKIDSHFMTASVWVCGRVYACLCVSIYVCVIGMRLLRILCDSRREIKMRFSYLEM